MKNINNNLKEFKNDISVQFELAYSSSFFIKQFKNSLKSLVLIIKTFLDYFYYFILLIVCSIILFFLIDIFNVYRDLLLILLGIFISTIITMFFVDPIKTNSIEINYYDETRDIINNLISIQESISLEFWQGFKLTDEPINKKESFKNILSGMYEIKRLNLDEVWKNPNNYNRIESRVRSNPCLMGNLIENIEKDIIELLEKLNSLPKNLIIYSYYFSFLEIESRIDNLKLKYDLFQSNQVKSCIDILKELQTCNNVLIHIFELLYEDFYFRMLFHTDKLLFD